MPPTKTKPRHLDDEDVDDLLADEAPVQHRGPETMQDWEYLGHEVASDLTLGGLATFLSVTNRGANLVAGTADLTAYAPVRIVTLHGEGRLELKPDDAKVLAPADVTVHAPAGTSDGGVVPVLAA